MSSIAWLSLGLLIAEPSPAHLEAWLARAPELLVHAPGMEASRRSREAARASVEASYRQAPWVLQTAVGYTHYLTEQVAGFVQGDNGQAVALTQDFELSAQASLGLALREGFRADLNVDAGLAGVGGTDLGASENLPYAVGLNVAYDLLRGGARSIDNEQARSEALRAFSAQLAADARALELELSLRRLLAAGFINRCKSTLVLRIREAVHRALLEAKVQLDARLMNQTDFLNFSDVSASVASREAGIELEYRVIRQQILGLAPAAVPALDALEVSEDACQIDLSHLEPMLATIPTEERLLEDAEVLPQVTSARARRLAALFDLNVRDTDLLPSLSPFLAGRVTRPAGLDTAVVSAGGGIELRWNVPGQKGHEARRAALEASAAARADEESALILGRSEILRLKAEMESGISLARALEDSVNNGRRLVETLNVRRAIGDIDSLNLSSAVIGNLNAEISRVEAAMDVVLRRDLLATYRAAGEQQRMIAHRLTEEAWTE